MNDRISKLIIKLSEEIRALDDGPDSPHILYDGEMAIDKKRPKFNRNCLGLSHDHRGKIEIEIAGARDNEYLEIYVSYKSFFEESLERFAQLYGDNWGSPFYEEMTKFVRTLEAGLKKFQKEWDAELLAEESKEPPTENQA